MPCATLTLASVQHYYNFIREQIKWTSFQQFLNYSHMLNLDTLTLWDTLPLPLHLPLKPDAVFKKQRASKVPEFEFLIYGSKHPTVLITDHKPINFLFTQKSNPNHRVYRFQLVLMKFPNLHIVCTARKKLVLPDTLGRNKPPEFLTRKTTVKYHKILNFS